MGFGRKVGAFLGLVPEDERAGYGDEYADGRRADQYDDFEGAEYAGEYGRDYGRDVAGDYADGYAADSYAEPAYATDRYAARAESSTRVDAGRGHSGFAAEPVTQGALAMQPLVAPRRDPDTKTGNRPVTIKLNGFADAAVIGEKYRDGQSVIMDMTEMNDSDARRLVDFAAGLAFAKRGSIDKVTTKVFMLLPSDIDAADISAEQRREFAGAYGR